MEDWQKIVINKNLMDLMQGTSLNAQFIACMTASGILETADKWELDAERNPGIKVFKFYSIIENKVNAFPCLIKALHSTCQSGIAHILESGVNSKLENKGDSLGGMESSQWLHINKNLDDLLLLTDLNVMVIAILRQKRILSESDVWALEAVGSEGAKILTFYDILHHKKDAYEGLIYAFEKTYQSGVVSILKSAPGQHESLLHN